MLLARILPRFSLTSVLSLILGTTRLARLRSRRFHCGRGLLRQVPDA